MVQDHVAATFGAGLAAACVVDVGMQAYTITITIMFCLSEFLCWKHHDL